MSFEESKKDVLCEVHIDLFIWALKKFKSLSFHIFLKYQVSVLSAVVRIPSGKDEGTWKRSETWLTSRIQLSLTPWSEPCRTLKRTLRETVSSPLTLEIRRKLMYIVWLMCKWKLSFYYKCESIKKYLIASFFSNFKELRCEAMNCKRYFPSPLHLSPALLFFLPPHKSLH